jgi:hypothetical protein
VPRLSIVIPALGHNDLLESGLVSVLEHRPSDSEVLVVLNDTYDDPYNLADEVRFVQAPAGADLLDCLNLGYHASAGSAIHFLGCGFEVSVGWADGPIARLEDSSIAAVVPVLEQPGALDSGVLAGVAYDPAGRAGVRFGSDTHWLSQAEPLGPIGLASFYSVEALQTVGEPFTNTVGPQWADIDLALRLRAAGYQVQLDGTSRIVGDPNSLVYVGPGLMRARYAERLYRRHAATVRTAPLAHLAVIAGEAAKSFPRPRCVTQLVGRMLGYVDSLGKPAVVPASSPSVPATMSESQRLDTSHDTARPALDQASPVRGRKSRARS